MKYVKIIVVLTLVCVFSAGILSLADLLTREKIAENQKKAFDQAITAIIPQASKVEQEEDIYKVFDATGQLKGYIVIAEGQGYQGPIKMICGLSARLDEILGIEVLESTETPGLGARINDKEFKEQFKGLGVSGAISYTKTEPVEDGQIQAITGATVSSRSVVAILNKRIEAIRKALKE
ncbi:RnfABCDGE type electron transport complex subunit G [Candidatus Omnitrophota bacterium]